MLIIEDWQTVKIIWDSDNSNDFKNATFPMPGFDQIDFPFFLVLGN